MRRSVKLVRHHSGQYAATQLRQRPLRLPLALLLVGSICCSLLLWLHSGRNLPHLHLLEDADIKQLRDTLIKHDADCNGNKRGLLNQNMDRTLRFQVCNGFANQRLSILYGVLLAVKTNRAVVLPQLVGVGTQHTGQDIIATEDNSLKFGAVYDQHYFIQYLAQYGVPVLQEQEAPALHTYTQVALSQAGFGSAMSLVAKTHANTAHVALDCPLFKLWPSELQTSDQELMWAILDALQPAASAAHAIHAATSHLSKAAVGAGHPHGAHDPPLQHYNVLHLRMEDDWIEHCQRWEALHDGIIRNNCYNNTETISRYLKVMGFLPSVPLYVASFWPDVEPQRRETMLQRLKAANFTVVTSRTLLPQLALHSQREQLALVEYYIALAAHQFIGNSVSSFAALALLERRHRGLWAAYYNTGNIPMTMLLPSLHRLPWVFTYNSWSEPYDYLLQAAVRSAIKHGSLKAYCIFIGNTSSPIFHWLSAHNVTLISHTPKWKDQLVQKAEQHLKENVGHSHLYKTPDMLVSTFQRVDLPVVPILNQYTYVLYTDADVFFRGRVMLDDFGLPLPEAISMSYEFRDQFPYNAGVMLLNLPAIRLSYRDLIRFIMANENGLFFGQYGPADQGALNQFYERQLKQRMMAQRFNAKPYNDIIADAAVVHYHGPKPHEYVAYLETGKCDFFWLCEQAFLRSLCSYMQQWAEFADSHPATSKLLDACTWLSQQEMQPMWTGMEPPTATLRELHQKKWGLADVHGDIQHDNRVLQGLKEEIEEGQAPPVTDVIGVVGGLLKHGALGI